MTDKKESVTIEQLKDKENTHGELVGCSYSSSSSGMMFNSNTLYYVSVDKQQSGQIITVRSKESLRDEISSTYKAKSDVLAAVSELADRENMQAWGELEYKQDFIVYDYSASEGVTLYYDDTPSGGYKKTPVSINAKAVRQQGRADVIDGLAAILEKGIEEAELISQQPSPADGNGMLANAPVTDDVQPDDDCWKCPFCGCVTNRGRFCCECGSKKPE